MIAFVLVVFAISMTLLVTGTASEARMAMITMTTRSSTSVNPRREECVGANVVFMVCSGGLLRSNRASRSCAVRFILQR